MSRGAGVVRSKNSLEETLTTLEKLSLFTSNDAYIDSWETTNLYYLAKAIVLSALAREESRGSHWREDFPETNPEWLKRIHQRMNPDGTWRSSFETVGVTRVIATDY
jgi:L-aspartate oxidase